MGVRAVDHQRVGAGLDQLGGALEVVARRPDRRRHAQAAQLVLARVGVADALLDVLDRDQPLERPVRVHHRELLDAVAVEDVARLLERGADRRGDQPLAGHDLVGAPLHAVLEAQVAVGEDADQPAVLGDRHARDVVARHDRVDLAQRRRGRQRHRVHDHAALRALDPVHLGALLAHREVLVDHPDPALARQRDRQLGLGDGVHRGAHDRDGERDAAREAGAGLDLARMDLREARDQQDIVEREGFGTHLRGPRHSVAHGRCGLPGASPRRAAVAARPLRAWTALRCRCSSCAASCRSNS